MDSDHVGCVGVVVAGDHTADDGLVGNVVNNLTLGRLFSDKLN